MVENEKLPFKEVSVLIAEQDEDNDMLEVVRQRLKYPAKRVRVNLDEISIKFDERALKEWQKLDKNIREQFKKKLKKLDNIACSFY